MTWGIIIFVCVNFFFIFLFAWMDGREHKKNPRPKPRRRTNEFKFKVSDFQDQIDAILKADEEARRQSKGGLDLTHLTDLSKRAPRPDDD